MTAMLAKTVARLQQAAKLPARQALVVHGHDAQTFLHGLTSTQVPEPLSGTSRYGAFLNSQGRVLSDAFFYALDSKSLVRQHLNNTDAPAYVIDVEQSEGANLVKHLRRYKLRAKVQLQLLDSEDLGIYAFWQGGDGLLLETSGVTDAQVHVDCRSPGMGLRAIVSGKADLSGLDFQPSLNYDHHRWQSGVAEGASEIIPGKTTVHNGNLDLMGAVDFKKGCYLGQELTIRTEHKGVVRRRILPVTLHGASQIPNAGSDIVEDVSSGWPQPTVRQRPSGRWLTGTSGPCSLSSDCQGFGLATCSLERMTELFVGPETSDSGYSANPSFAVPLPEGGHATIQAHVPKWMRPLLRSGALSTQRVES